MSYRPLISALAFGITGLGIANAGEPADFIFEYHSEDLLAQTAHAQTMERLTNEAQEFCTDSRVRGLEERRFAARCQEIVIETVTAELADTVMRFSENQQ